MKTVRVHCFNIHHCLYVHHTFKTILYCPCDAIYDQYCIESDVP